MSLTPSQQFAVTHYDGPMLIIAGPGSGKTRVITHRIAWMLENGVRPDEVLALTFTNKAAEEIQSRVAAMLGDDDFDKKQNRVWISTYHRFAARLLRHYAPYVGLGENFTIYDKDDSLSALKKAIQQHRQTATTHLSANFSASTIASAISAAKTQLQTADEYAPPYGDLAAAVAAEIYPHYQQALRLANAVDFDDLLLLAMQLLKTQPTIRAALDAQYRYILVDEYQDTNFAQYAIARALSTDTPNLTVTGDPDQSIYGWRGANIGNILDFEKDFPGATVVNLGQNYRSTRRILATAETLISHNTLRKENPLFTENPAGVPVTLSRYDSGEHEANIIARQIADAISCQAHKAAEFAIFYRVNSLAVEFEKALRLSGVPYRVLHGMEFFARREVRDVLAYLRLLQNPHDNEALLRIINVPARGIGKTTLEHLGDFAWRERLSLWEAAAQAQRCESIKKRAQSALAAFVFAMHQMHETYTALENGTRGGMTALIEAVIDFSGYAALCRDVTGTDDEAEKRRTHLAELVSLARQFDAKHARDATGTSFLLERFLEETSLSSDTDDLDEAEDRVHLMTLHAAKGLEFPVVYLTALEHGILPHQRSADDPTQLEEERRLMFVGMTRAREELHLSFTAARNARGKTRTAAPSRFLMELPRDEMHTTDATLAALDAAESSFDVNHADADFFFPEDDSWDFELPPEEHADAAPSDASYFDADDSAPPVKKSKPGKSLPDIPGLMTAAEMLKKKKP